MKKTCFNCRYFHHCLSEDPPSQYHVHGYCEKFNQVLKQNFESEVNSFLKNSWYTMTKATPNLNYGVSDDFETSEAMCWMFSGRETPYWPDEKFDENKKHNEELAIQTLEYMFETKQVVDDIQYEYFSEPPMCPIDVYYSEEEINQLKELLSKLKDN